MSFFSFLLFFSLEGLDSDVLASASSSGTATSSEADSVAAASFLRFFFSFLDELASSATPSSVSCLRFFFDFLSELGSSADSTIGHTVLAVN